MGGADDWLPLSGIQHFCFCRRQWALIHLEQQWAENRRTVEGQLDHARCHDTNQTERRGGLLITRGMQVVSRRLGLSGNCDVVEFRAAPAGIPLQSSANSRPKQKQGGGGRARGRRPGGGARLRGNAAAGGRAADRRTPPDHPEDGR